MVKSRRCPLPLSPHSYLRLLHFCRWWLYSFTLLTYGIFFFLNAAVIAVVVVMYLKLYFLKLNGWLWQLFFFLKKDSSWGLFFSWCLLSYLLFLKWMRVNNVKKGVALVYLTLKLQISIFMCFNIKWLCIFHINDNEINNILFFTSVFICKLIKIIVHEQLTVTDKKISVNKIR